jgi:hypothetical protein
MGKVFCQPDLGRMIEARTMLFAHYLPQIARIGKKLTRITAVDASLIKLLRVFKQGGEFKD